MQHLFVTFAFAIVLSHPLPYIPQELTQKSRPKSRLPDDDRRPISCVV